MLELNKIHQGDCLELGHEIEPGSVDLILTDLPYGTIEGLGGGIEKYKRLSGSKWDVAIDPKEVYAVANRILRKNGKMVLFSQEPYTTLLVNEAISNVPFSYRMMWEKDHFANCLVSKKAPVSYYEDILVFSKTHETTNTHPVAPIVKTLQEESGSFWNGEIAEYYVKNGYSKSINNAKAVLKHYLSWEYVQFSVVTKKHYDILSTFFDWGYSHEELKKIDNAHKQKYPSTFNLWEGNKYKSNILKYKKDYNGYHPTQKPLLLLEDLIKTFSNDGDLVVDLTCGSGSTCVAAQNTGRSFIGIEKEEEYVDIANERIKQSHLMFEMR